MFDDGSCYIGQTVNPIARLSDHYRRYTNSVDRFILLAVDVKKLLEVELEYIGVTEEFNINNAGTARDNRLRC